MTDATKVTTEFDPLDDEEFPDEMPARPRRRWLTPWSAVTLALLVGAIGFYVGIRVQKAEAGGGSSTASAIADRSGFAGLSGASASARSRFAAAAAGGGFPGAGGASGNSVSGSVSSRDGNTLYVTESGGNIVKVKLSAATTVTKSESVGKGKISPGDEVTVSGQKGAGKGASVTAVSVTDSGASSSSSSSTSSSSGGASSSSGGSGSVSSLFGG